MRNIYKYMRVLALLMYKKDLYLLLYLAEKTHLHQPLQTSTVQIAADLCISQQTVSRKLQDFAVAGLIERTLIVAGIKVHLTSTGKKVLQQLYGDLHRLFGQRLSLRGTVKDGLGEGRFYMSQKGYTQQFQSILGFVPYPGTLNIAVDKHTAATFLATKQQFSIAGFQTKERSFGGLKCYPVLINTKIVSAVIVPDRTVHTLDTVEVIAPVYLREELKLQNGKEVLII